MPIIEIEGGKPLKGAVQISGSKNGALPLLAASILSDGVINFRNVPAVVDVKLLCELLRQLGLRVDWPRDSADVEVEVEDEKPDTASYELVDKMRASICVLGPLVARRGRARLALPGGCSIGPRPIDIHLRALEAMGADVQRKKGDIVVNCKRLKGAEIDLLGANGPTVTGTCNILSAAVLAEGRTLLKNCAREPEVMALCDLLITMGAQIGGVGTDRLTVDGVPSLYGADVEIIPDRIEAGTYMIAAAITGGDVLLQNVKWEHVGATVDALQSANVSIIQELFGCQVKTNGRPKATQVKTAPFPGFATDLQAPMMCLLSIAEGTSTLTDTIFPNRFMHVDELNRFGADIVVKNNQAQIHGVEDLGGALVTAKDLRACAAMIIAGLAADGVTRIREPNHIDRGYERIEEKITSLGGTIRRVDEEIVN